MYMASSILVTWGVGSLIPVGRMSICSRLDPELPGVDVESGRSGAGIPSDRAPVGMSGRGEDHCRLYRPSSLIIALISVAVRMARRSISGVQGGLA